MCGIVGYLRTPKDVEAYELNKLESFLGELAAKDSANITHDEQVKLTAMAAKLISASGVVALVKDQKSTQSINLLSEQIKSRIEQFEIDNDLDEDQKENVGKLYDALWRISKDSCSSAEQITELVKSQSHSIDSIPAHVIAIYRSINIVLRSIDRIEVRGRDSAGISVCLSSIDVDDVTKKKIAKRNNETFTNNSVRFAVSKNGNEQIFFVYKRAAEIGELGDNINYIRNAITNDDLLFDVISANVKAQEVVLAHTRWASMGVISEENAHPLDSFESSDSNSSCAIGVLNGDIDNHVQLRSNLDIDLSITTDAKLIPVLLKRDIDSDSKSTPLESFRSVVSTFEGSTAIGAVSSEDTASFMLGMRGGGQGLYIGLGSGEFLVASEPYGVVEIASSYVRMDGEVPHDANQPVNSRGQIVRLQNDEAGSLASLERIAYDGKVLPISEDEIIVSEVTTRDIDRGKYEHYLWKEINEAPRSFEATIHGKLISENNSYDVSLSEEILPKNIIEKITSKKIAKVMVIGQGTAAVAGQACAHFFDVMKSELQVEYSLATEISGFNLKPDMSDYLVIAVSQSGTTTDTNRTVDLLHDRGASVIAIVNRRGSDLATKADGVFYTSSGRDVEMSVASTKAFYSQVAAGSLLAVGVCKLLNEDLISNSSTQDVLNALEKIPDMMREALQLRSEISTIAKRTVLSRRSWASVGNGPNSIASREIRIKSSELCYKALANDVTEDKKHIDLSCEPLIVVCATGLTGSTADDVSKEVSIFKAHKAMPVVITDDDSERFDSCDNVITVPKTDPNLSFILCCVAGHIYGYESALAIDASAIVLRQARGALAELTPKELESRSGITLIGDALEPAKEILFKALAEKQYDAVLDSSDCFDLVKLFIALTNPFPTEIINASSEDLSTPFAMREMAALTLTRCIDQLTRPIDAIRHQAKTVTVGISRSDDTLLQSKSLSYLIDSGIERDSLTFGVIRILLSLDDMVAEITGHTRYSIEGDADHGDATVQVDEQVGSAANLTSRVGSNPKLRGTKSLAAREQTVWVARGKSDGRNVILIPEIKRSKCVGITLLHIDVENNLDLDQRKNILEGYKQKLFALRDSVTETEDTFDESKLLDFDIIDLLTQPVATLSQNWISK